MTSLLCYPCVTQDDIAAYKTQNKFLNSEIYQLTKLWRKSSEQEKSLMVKVRRAHVQVQILLSPNSVQLCAGVSRGSFPVALDPHLGSPEMQFGSQEVVDYNPLIMGNFRIEKIDH